LVSHSTFGSHADPQAAKMRRVRDRLWELAPDLEVEGEMPADVAMIPEIRQRIFPESRLKGQPNLLIMPDQDSAHIAFHFGRVVGRAVSVEPILMGVGRPAHVLTPSASVRRVVNMTAIAVVEAQQFAKHQPSAESDD
jgi:malate dehydrogenase (oxaloacetate-decarboxylating)(NADP+)